MAFNQFFYRKFFGNQNLITEQISKNNIFICGVNGVFVCMVQIYKLYSRLDSKMSDALR